MNKKKILNNYGAISLVTLFVASFVFAQGPEQSFKYFAELEPPNLKFPRVVELDISEYDFSDLVVQDKGSGNFLPGLILYDIKKASPSVVSGGGSRPEALFDGDFNSYSDFGLQEDGKMTRSEIIVDFGESASVDGLNIYLGDNVRLPNYILIYDLSNAKILLNKVAVQSGHVKFPKTVTRQLAVRFEHSQPLRVAEIVFESDDKISGKKLRFLAQPGSSYNIYAQRDYYTVINFQEEPNLRDDDGLVKIKERLSFAPNPVFKEKDSDKDGVPDKLDNCVNVKNPDQKDMDKNGRGDACDDFDKDGVANILDNCPNIPNRAQKDTDRDGKGDACDSEESRFFEKNSWLVWLASGVLLLVFFAMFAVLLRKEKSGGEYQDKNE